MQSQMDKRDKQDAGPTALTIKDLIRGRRARWWPESVNDSKSKTKSKNHAKDATNKPVKSNNSAGGDHSSSACLQTLKPLIGCCSMWQRKLEDKLLARAFVTASGVPVPRLLWSGKDADKIPFRELEKDGEPYVIKTSMGACGRQVRLMHNGADLLHWHERVSHADIREHMQFARKTYPTCTIMAEEAICDYLHDTANKKGLAYRRPVIYRFLVRGDQVIAVGVDNDWWTRWLDGNWNTLPYCIKEEEREHLHRPLRLPPVSIQKQLLEYARRLGVAYQVFVRIDFFAGKNGIAFNEFSQTPWLGSGFTPEGNALMLRYWDKEKD